MNAVNIILGLIFLGFTLFLLIFDPESLPRALLMSLLALAFGYSKPVREFRKRNFKPDVKLMWLFVFNLILLMGMLIFGYLAGFKHEYFPCVFVGASVLGVASVIFYGIRYRGKRKS